MKKIEPNDRNIVSQTCLDHSQLLFNFLPPPSGDVQNELETPPTVPPPTMSLLLPKRQPFSVCLAWKVNYSQVWGQTPEGKNCVRDYEDMTFLQDVQHCAPVITRSHVYAMKMM